VSGKGKKYQGFGTIRGVKRVLWHILQRAEAKIDDTAVDDESCRGWANTAIQAALAYGRLHESHVIEGELGRLEAAISTANGNGHAR
jgi:hypothetical protein